MLLYYILCDYNPPRFKKVQRGGAFMVEKDLVTAQYSRSEERGSTSSGSCSETKFTRAKQMKSKPAHE